MQAIKSEAPQSSRWDVLLVNVAGGTNYVLSIHRWLTFLPIWIINLYEKKLRFWRPGFSFQAPSVMKFVTLECLTTLSLNLCTCNV